MKRQRNCSPLKEQDKILKIVSREINTLSDKEFKALVTTILTELGKRIDVQSRKFNKKIYMNQRTQAETQSIIYYNTRWKLENTM